MKNFNFTLLGQYKFIQTNITLLFLLISSYSVTLNAQDGGSAPVATMQYSVNKTVTYGIPDNSPISNITDFDISKVRAFEESSSETHNLHSDGSISIITIYPEGTKGIDIWIQPYYKSVLTKNKLSYYDQNNQVLFSKDVNISFPNVTITPEIINNYGYSEKIEAPTSTDISNIVQTGMTYSYDNHGNHYLTSEDVVYIMNPSNNTKISNYYKDGILNISVLEKFSILPNGKSICIGKTTKTYLDTDKGIIKLEKKIVEVYYNHIINGTSLNTNHKIVSNSKELAGQLDIHQYKISEIENQNSVNVYPNPSNGIYNIKLSSAYLNDGEIKILDLNGKVIRTYEKNNSVNEFKIDLSDLSKGMYFFRIDVGGNYSIQRIVNQ